jgi:gamma-glutamylcyclotransferase (GGCT)/AIG2-like uncharacterized protein YtfP
MDKNQRLFVYGTLKKGQYFHEKYLSGEKSNFLGVGYAGPDYSLYVGAQPHLIREPSDKPVKGELYEVSPVVLESLDGLEGHPIVYKRELVEVFTELGEKTLAWAYLRHQNFRDKINCEKEYEYV